MAVIIVPPSFAQVLVGDVGVFIDLDLRVRTDRYSAAELERDLAPNPT